MIFSIRTNVCLNASHAGRIGGLESLIDKNRVSSVPTGMIISLQSVETGKSKSKWCTVSGAITGFDTLSNTGKITCIHQKQQPGLEFVVVNAGDGTRALKGTVGPVRVGSSSTVKYSFCSNGGGENGIQCTSDEMNDAAKINVEDLGDGKVALIGWSKDQANYCRNDNGKSIKCDVALDVAEKPAFKFEERWKLLQHGKSIVLKHENTDQYCRVDSETAEKSVVCDQTRKEFTSEEEPGATTFTVVDAPDDFNKRSRSFLVDGAVCRRTSGAVQCDGDAEKKRVEAEVFELRNRDIDILPGGTESLFSIRDVRTHDFCTVKMEPGETLGEMYCQEKGDAALADSLELFKIESAPAADVDPRVAEGLTHLNGMSKEVQKAVVRFFFCDGSGLGGTRVRWRVRRT